jgi:hypothetical protein
MGRFGPGTVYRVPLPEVGLCGYARHWEPSTLFVDLFTAPDEEVTPEMVVSTPDCFEYGCISRHGDRDK